MCLIEYTLFSQFCCDNLLNMNIFYQKKFYNNGGYRK